MALKPNATCAICGKEYVMCYSCKHDRAAAPWKMHCDTAEHYKVYQIINGYTCGVYTDKEATKKFKNVNLDDVDEFRPHIRDIVKKLMDIDSEPVENDKPVRTAKRTRHKKTEDEQVNHEEQSEQVE